MSANQVLNRSDREDVAGLIRKRAGKEIKKVVAVSPNWEHGVREKAKKRAIKELGIEKELVEKEKLQAKVDKLEEEIQKVDKVIETRLPFKLGNLGYSSCPIRKELCVAVNDIAIMAEEAARSADPVGKKVIAIEQDMDRRLTLLVGCSTNEDVKTSGCLVW